MIANNFYFIDVVKSIYNLNLLRLNLNIFFTLLDFEIEKRL